MESLQTVPDGRSPAARHDYQNLHIKRKIWRNALCEFLAFGLAGNLEDYSRCKFDEMIIAAKPERLASVKSVIAALKERQSVPPPNAASLRGRLLHLTQRAQGGWVVPPSWLLTLQPKHINQVHGQNSFNGI